MKHIPILFSTEMVQAILEGRKKMTRRVVNPQPNTQFRKDDRIRIYKRGDKWEVKDKLSDCFSRLDCFSCKYDVGDILWVRESFASSPFDDNVFVYKADAFKHINTPNKHKYKPSIHMPKKACRIFLKVTDVRCERLHEITEQDAVDEGILDMWSNVYDKKDNLHAYLKYDVTHKEKMEPGGHWAHVADDAIHSFQSLWAKINGQSSWDANPYVWVISFERCDRPSDFLNQINK